jgi:hypothetical protein
MAVSQALLDALWDFSDPVGSEGRLRDAAGAESRPDGRAVLETQVARALGLQGRFDDADAVLRGVPPVSPVVRVRVALERGRVRNSAGDPEGARPLFASAADESAAAVDEDSPDAAALTVLRVDALHMLAIADPERAPQWTAHAREVLDSTSDPRTRRWLVALHTNAGWAHFDAGRPGAALAEFEKARDAAVRWGTPVQVRWADEAIAEARAAL